jgi:hypothetical protein
MKNNNINQKIMSRYNELLKSPNGEVWTKIENNIDDTIPKKRYNKFFKLRPIIITAIIFALFITTVVAAAPYIIIRMLGSDNIDFFSFALNNNNNIFYAGDYDLIKQYSSEVGITAEGKDYSFTVDNIAFDGTFLSVFYTVEKKANILEELQTFSKKWSGIGETDIEVSERNAVSVNEIGFKIADLDLPLYGQAYNNSRIDGYLVSDHEIKMVKRFIITEDLPDIFDIEITHFNIFDDGLMRMIRAEILAGNKETFAEKVYDRMYKKGLHIALTIDINDSRLQKLTVNPGLTVKITQDTETWKYLNEVQTHYIETTERSLTVDKVSISPLGNILMLTEAGASDEKNKFLFNKFFIVDDKGNIYRARINKWYRENPEEDVTFIVEFFGYVPEDAAYIKIIPYNSRRSGYTANDFSIADLDNLPARINYSNYGDIIIESSVVTDENIIVTYRTEGMVDDNLWLNLNWEITEHTGGISSYQPLYDRSTDLYTVTYTFKNPVENARDIIKTISTAQYDLDLLEEQAIIIPLN